uniref:RNA-dependent RNA polymerase n=1 Tax=Paramecium bursaria TaxID=74790 RepID=A0A8G1G0Q9_9CILI|nr:RNA-dependent RNA polymerase 4 [Paramecium bursaria]
MKYTFNEYYDFEQLLYKFRQHKNQMVSIEKSGMYLMFHSEINPLKRLIDIIIELGKQVFIKITIELVTVHFIQIEELKDHQIISIKLLSPPQFNITLNDKRRNESNKTRSDWQRIHNLLLDQVRCQVRRLILINNSMIRMKIRNIEDNYYFIQQFNNIMLQYNLLNPKPVIEEGQLYDKEQVYRFPDDLSFQLKYNLLCALSNNRINSIDNLKLIAEYSNKSEHKFYTQNDKFIDVLFAQLMKGWKFLGTSYNYQDQRHNLQLFSLTLKNLKTEFINHQTQDIRIVNIRRISLTPSGIMYHFKLPEQSNLVQRIFKDHLDCFLRLNFEDENLTPIFNMQYVCQYFFPKIFDNGIRIEGNFYQLLTWSSSQLRTAQCWLFNFKQANITRVQMIEQLGDFTNLKINEVAKNAARLGQSFSSSLSFQFKQDVNIIHEPDVYDSDQNNYTDGIGKISRNLIQQIREKLQNFNISAIQIRYHGAKGVLLLNDDLEDNTIVIRKSMQKYTPAQNANLKQIELLDFNKFRGGYLNRQIIMLLISLNVVEDNFQKIFYEHLQKLDDLQFKDSSIYKYFNLDYCSEIEGMPPVTKILTELINDGMQLDHYFIEGIMNRLKRRGLLLLKNKCNILVDQAGRFLGVTDDYNLLNENEVYVCVKNINSEVECISGNVCVVRNPCLHPGDVRVVRAISEQEIRQRFDKNPYAEFFNCIVFPRKGKSLPCQSAGGDLDGDLYYVAWDERIVPHLQDVYPPMNYQAPAPNALQRVDAIYGNQEDYFQEQKMKEFLFTYLNSDVLGKIDNSHLGIAEKSYLKAKDEKCLKLAILHSDAVDFVKHGIEVKIPTNLKCNLWPDYMEKENKLIQFDGQSILGRIYREICNIVKTQQDLLEQDYKGYNNPTLPSMEIRYIYKYRQYLDEINNQNIDVAQQSAQNYVRLFTHDLDQVCECIKSLFKDINNLCNLYDIQSEYEIYTGNFTNFNKHDKLKKKLNIDIMQKRVLMQLIQMKQFILKSLKLDELDEETKMYKISLMHFILQYSPTSNLNLEDNFLREIKKQFDRSGVFKRLTEYEKWYRGLSWFFLYEDLIKKNDVEELI